MTNNDNEISKKSAFDVDNEIVMDIFLLKTSARRSTTSTMTINIFLDYNIHEFPLPERLRCIWPARGAPAR